MTTIEDVLQRHRERMRQIGDADLRSVGRLARLNSLLIYRTARRLDTDETDIMLAELIATDPLASPEPPAA